MGKTEKHLEQHIVEVLIDKLVYGGEGLGRLDDGRAVFVPFVIPGERVRLQITEQKKGYARGELLEVLEPHPERIQPRCPYYGNCGGCHFQHMPYEMQRIVKQSVLQDQMQRIGGFDDLSVSAVVPSPKIWAYRNHLQFHLTPEGELGYVNLRGDAVVPIDECPLMESGLKPLWQSLVFDPDTGLNRVALRAGTSSDNMLILESEDPQAIEFNADIPASVVYRGPGGEIVLAGDDYIVMEISGKTFRVSAGSFFQVNTAVAELMVAHVLEGLSLSGEETLVDAYCGVGLFSAFLAERVKAVVGIETSSSACADYVVNLDAFENVSLYEAPVEAVLPVLKPNPDVVLLDPPRAGLDKSVIDALAAIAPKQLVYISCDPATLARDARRLSRNGFALKKITPFDMFPQTYHIESISFWHVVE